MNDGQSDDEGRRRNPLDAVSNETIVRLSLIGAMCTLSVMIGLSSSDAGVKAPLLTMMGGFTALVALFPARKPTIADIGFILATAIAVAGSYFWYLDATPNDDDRTLLLIIPYLIFAVAWVLWAILWAIKIVAEIYSHFFAKP